MSWFRKSKRTDTPTLRRPLTRFNEIVYAVGDIHGRDDLLESLLTRIQTDFEDTSNKASFELSARLVFLGDYVDRGPDSKAVLERLSGLDLPNFKTVFLKGNHEMILLDILDRPNSFRSWLTHGGDTTVESYGITVDKTAHERELEGVRQSFCAAVPDEHKAFLRRLQSFHREDPLFFAHAGVNPKKPLEAQDEGDLLWIREEFLGSRKTLPLIVVHGHTPQNEPSWDGRRIGLDTGAYFTNRLVSAKIHDNSVDFIST